MGGAVAPRRSPLLVRIEPLKAGLAALVLFGVLAAAAQASPVAVVLVPTDEPFPANGGAGAVRPRRGRQCQPRERPGRAPPGEDQEVGSRRRARREAADRPLDEAGPDDDLHLPTAERKAPEHAPLPDRDRRSGLPRDPRLALDAHPRPGLDRRHRADRQGAGARRPPPDPGTAGRQHRHAPRGTRPPPVAEPRRPPLGDAHPRDRRPRRRDPRSPLQVRVSRPCRPPRCALGPGGGTRPVRGRDHASPPGGHAAAGDRARHGGAARDPARAAAVGAGRVPGRLPGRLRRAGPRSRRSPRSARARTAAGASSVPATWSRRCC